MLRWTHSAARMPFRRLAARPLEHASAPQLARVATQRPSSAVAPAAAVREAASRTAAAFADAVSGLTSKATASPAPSLAPKLAAEPPPALSACGDVDEEEDDDEYEEMFVKTSFGGSIEWGGPLRGGRMPEPTRFGDWERKGRCTDW